ncbi:type II toxin-antitoxin system Phd/YefM family antitoxin [Rhodobacteraceae bacterium HSP-20]|uniref:Type II toxin-antitoxin system Phd/YefM family antitoxin n=1 Tax=Paragemmobacter amnigenus TaxID=2852097 RepID=A0ABS6J207_9RHOB|nr:hypothetical protein [Rhodobacter amnigenus]MBU9696914.1 type II toxin-antitoxin system Phd/YefM family antitoxin [Rhodobacter amnigenus]MBV4388141.1 type II toxin-antitoxin system Phd/YefM family antitoxin [Rhodobacter amnigenus]
MENPVHTASLTEMRNPGRVLDAAGGRPVAIRRHGATIGYIVPPDLLAFPDEDPALAMRRYLAGQADRVMAAG